MRLKRREFFLTIGASLLIGRRAFADVATPRRLRLRNEHTGESFDGYYRDPWGPIPEAISDLAVFLRDFHADKIGPVHIDTLDFLTDVMDGVGIETGTVLSGYRTRETNERIAATTFGVAENSQHIVGRAIDVTFDKHLEDAERAARAMKRGGVGWYPDSHFIHLDSGPVRNWDLGGKDLVAEAEGTWIRKGWHLPTVCRGAVCTKG